MNKKTALAISFTLLLVGTSAWAVEEIDVNLKLKERINSNKTKIIDIKLKNALENLVLDSVKFKGTAVSGPLNWELPKGASIKNGKLSVNDELLDPPNALVSDTLTNKSNLEQQMGTKLSKTLVTSESFTTNTTLGIESTFTIGGSIILVSGEASTSFSLTQELGYRKSWGENYTFEKSLSVTVPAKHYIEASIMGQTLDLVIPWSVDVALKGKTIAHFVAQAPPNAEMWGVTLYRDEKYKDDSDFYGLKSGKTLSIPDLKHFNDRTSSLKLHGKVKVTLYEKKKYKGKSRIFTRSYRSIGSINDKASSMKITALETPPTPIGILVYYHSPYKDRKKFFPVVGNSKLYEIGGGNFNNKVSSIERIGPAKVTLFDEAGGTGKSIELKNHKRDLKKNKFGDKTTSLRVDFAGAGQDVTFDIDSALSDPALHKFTCKGSWQGSTVERGHLFVDEEQPIQVRNKKRTQKNVKKSSRADKGIATLLSKSLSDKNIKEVKAKLKNGSQARIEPVEKKILPKK